VAQGGASDDDGRREGTDPLSHVVARAAALSHTAVRVVALSHVTRLEHAMTQGSGSGAVARASVMGHGGQGGAMSGEAGTGAGGCAGGNHYI
jgi:hypothetical protein